MHGKVTDRLMHLLQVVRELDKEDLALLVQFVTGTSKVPLDGFKALQVRCADQGLGSPRMIPPHPQGKPW